jgi:NAD(P)H-dependent FMN reductase/peroxiredoxin
VSILCNVNYSKTNGEEKMKILAFAGSSSRISINKELVKWVASHFSNDTITILDLNDFEMPIFSVDKERENGIPQLALDFAKAIDTADLLLISMAEHNGNYSAAFKNIFDWVSRIPKRSVFENTPIFLMATSTGRRGASTVLTIAERRFPYNGGDIIDTFSLPSFDENFEKGKGITHRFYRKELLEKVDKIKEHFYRQNLMAGNDFEIGKPLPEWSLESIFGDDVPKIEDFKGKPLLILFFYMGCLGCKARAIPFANRVVYEDKGVQVLGIHTRFEGKAFTHEELKAAKEEYHIRFPFYQDKEYAQTFWKYKAAGTPHWVLLDENGIISYALFGSEPNNALMRLDYKMDELLN